MMNPWTEAGVPVKVTNAVRQPVDWCHEATQAGLGHGATCGLVTPGGPWGK